MRGSLKERKMHGRVTRPFVSPILHTMISLMQTRRDHDLEDLFRYHASYHYPLAGVLSFSSSLVRGINIDYDCCIEISILSEVYNRVAKRKIVQIDLITNYEHKHQKVSEKDAKKGLHRMVIDITKFYLTYIRSKGHILRDEFIDMLREMYYQNALIFLKRYSDDAEYNELKYDRYKEETLVHLFYGFISEAWQEVKCQDTRTQFPSWNRVAYSIPGIYKDLLEAVEKDNSTN